eukprot:TRINITY_DN7147_c0_g1_i1.p1 TRINITY_DN7147_c0_g1~~TRINITY_DN7147_c0_g1_i1.p1  ORF type:complete len:437 (-),score=138.16 TRINITY_DN7147_c0_g1_i1:39-1349(-)
MQTSPLHPSAQLLEVPTTSEEFLRNKHTAMSTEDLKLTDLLEQVKTSTHTYLHTCVPRSSDHHDKSSRAVRVNFSEEVTGLLKSKLRDHINQDGMLVRKNVHYPLRFESDREKLNFMTTLHLVNFGSFVVQDTNDTEYCQDGILWTSLRGCMGMHLSGSKFNANWFTGIGSPEIESWFGLSRTVDRRVFGKNSPVYQAEDSDEKPLIDTLVKVLNDAGRVLLTFGKDDFFDFFEFADLFANARRMHAADDEGFYHVEVSVADVVEKLAKNIYGFMDKYEVELEDGQRLEIWLLSKAQKLAMQLAGIEEFSFEGKKYKLQWADADRLNIAVDNDVIRALVNLGVLAVADKEQLQYQVDERTGRKVCPDSSVDFECELRSTAVEACLQMLDHLTKDSESLKFASHLDRVALLQHILWQTSLASKSICRGILKPKSPFF